MLPLLLLLQQASAADIVHRSEPIVKHISSCPDVGYFFIREATPNAIHPGSCMLCFCKEHGSAVCWRRDSSRCDAKNYQHYGKRDTRFRRSPGFTDIFFRDATRDVLDKRTPEQCKPYESSFSEGCPPADWCIGCTVCDCDANGRWDCHILSFCPDKKGNKEVQKNKKPLRNKNVKHSNKKIYKRSDQRTPNKTPSKTNASKKMPSTKVIRKAKSTKPSNKVTKKTPIKKSAAKRSPNTSKQKVKTLQAKKISPINKNKKKISKTTTIRARTTKFIKKKASPVQQAKRKSYRLALQNVKEKNDTFKLAEAIVKKVMSNVEKLMNENQKNINKTRLIQKRSMQLQDKNNNKIFKKGKRKPWNKQLLLKKETFSPQYKKREKRSIGDLETTSSSTALDFTTEIFFWNKTNFELLEMLNINMTTTSIRQSKDYYKYDFNVPGVSKLPNLTDINRVYPISNKSIHFLYDSTTAQPKIKRLKDFVPIKNKAIKWKDLDVLLSSEYTKRMHQKWNATLGGYNSSTSHKMLNNSCGKLCNFKKVIKKLFLGLQPNILINSNSVGNDEVKNRNVDLISTLRNLFKPLFAKKARTKKFIHDQRQNSILNALCKKFNLCHSDINDKVLQSKLTDLNHETYKILKIISSIKGLLYLLSNTGNLTRHYQANDVDKLNAILREFYTMDKNLNNITETQRAQIQYVKENTQNFVKSLEKFALTLNDIIRILQKQNKDSKLNIKRTHRNLRCASLSNQKNKSIDDKITRLKRLLLSYNLVQNKFMSKMYDALTSLQKNVDDSRTKVSEKRNYLNSTVKIDTYSKTIIENLRKLKELGQKLNSNGRTKREAMGDEDAIEYLLMLMEYLLKQNKPVSSPPVSDGIDLLIDAIKNAPDIKPIKFNTVRLTSKPPTPTRTTESTEKISNSRENKINRERGNSDKKLDSVDIDIYGYDYKNKNHGKINEKYVTSTVDKALKEYNVEKNTENTMEEVTEQSIPVYILHKQDPDLTGENLEEKIVKHKFEVYNADVEDEDDAADIIFKKDNVSKEEIVLKAEKDVEKEHEKLMNQVRYNIITPKSNINNKNTFYGDGGDDNTDFEFKSDIETTTRKIATYRTVKPEFVTRTIKRYKDKYANPISTLSSEEIANAPKKKTHSGLNKIDFFNSFDYTEKPDADSDSKEDKNEAFSDFT